MTVGALLQVDNAKVWFGGVRAVNGVTMSAEAGRVYGIVGPNGSGKTTLVNGISRMTPLTSGSIFFDGQDVTRLPTFQLARRGVARTFQNIRLLPSLSVFENVASGADAVWSHDKSGRRLGRRERNRITTEVTEAALERLGIAQFRKLSPAALSYGNQRRVEIARALATGCRLLLLDEPVAGMNRAERYGIAEIVRDLATSDGMCVLIIEHDVRLMLDLCDHLYVMNFGTVVAHGAPKEVAALPVVQEAYLGKKHATA